MKKALLIVAGCLAMLLVLLLWLTRESAVTGTYEASGSWGKSTLTLEPDHSMLQTVTLSGSNHDQMVKGRWESRGREFLDQNISLMPFIALAAQANGRKYDAFETYYGPVGLTGFGIDADSGANIAYRKVAK